MPDAASCVKVTHRIVEMPKVAALTPACVHGETDDRPSPTPRISRISDNAAAPAAPASTALHDTPLAFAETRSSSALSASVLSNVGSRSRFDDFDTALMIIRFPTDVACERMRWRTR